MKKIYKITFKKVDWDEYRGFIVVANNKKEAKGLCHIKSQPSDYGSEYEENIDKIELIGISKKGIKEGIILGDFKAG